MREGSVPCANKIPHISEPHASAFGSISHTLVQTSRKRKPASLYNEVNTARDGEVEFLCSELDGSVGRHKKKKINEVPVIRIEPPPSAFPRSIYDGHLLSGPFAEASLLREILTEEEGANHQELGAETECYSEVDLTDFEIYRENTVAKRHDRREEFPRANELVSLHEINEWGVQHFYFDGQICHGGNRKYVQRIPFELLSIGGYGELECLAQPDVWVQSIQGTKAGIWYRLRNPALGYRRYHASFSWMAGLARNVVGFLITHEHVNLEDFRSNFYEWMHALEAKDELVGKWLLEYGRRDFRHAVASQANFLWCQATQVYEELESQPFWSEIHPRFLTAVPAQIETDTQPEMFAMSDEGVMINRRKTTVTPFVYESFRHLHWAKFLYCQTPLTGQTLTDRKKELAPPHDRREVKRVQNDENALCHEPSIQVGDVVALPLDTKTTWKSMDKDWYGYVQTVTASEKGPVLGLLWLYRPSDTPCLNTPYPYPRELFLSDHCNCGDTLIYAQEVISRPKIAFFSGPAAQGDFFVRQKYIEADGAWESLKDSDFRCCCNASKVLPVYTTGDTLLIRSRNLLEPVIFVRKHPDGSPGKVEVKRLIRKNRDCYDMEADANELILTDELRIIPEGHIDRECMIRHFTLEEKRQQKIPPPYKYGGTGDFFYIITQGYKHDGSDQDPSQTDERPGFKEGWDPLDASYQPQSLLGLDLFCGGGNFGRGLEESQAVDFKWAVDWSTEAIHTYKANMRIGKKPQLFQGSVNDYLTKAMQNKGSPSVAPQDKVEFIAAGSPCQGFSVANPKKGNDRSLFNVSMVASVLAFVDFYRPRYAILENVKGMAGGNDNANVLALVISVLLGMGYQVRTFALDAWNYGSPQRRSRVFISIAAPGLTPLPEPPHTHSHPDDIISSSLGKTANGLRTSCRYTSRTPFKYITSEEATKDLPATDARTSCIPFPDHRMSRTLSLRHRIQISSIPRFPAGGNFHTAMKKGYMPQTQIDAFPWRNAFMAKSTSCWQRVRCNALMPTIMTEPRPDDGAGGQCLHWDKDRLLTIMEARRGQGFPDDEVLIGLPGEQWKIIGNSVARPVALALGLSLRKAWLCNHEQALNAPNAWDNKTPLIANKNQQSNNASANIISSKLKCEGDRSGHAKPHQSRSLLPSLDDLVVTKINGISKLLIKDSNNCSG